MSAAHPFYIKSIENKAKIGTSSVRRKSQILNFNDERVYKLTTRYRAQGYTVSILPQSPKLPHGHTREDILIEKP